MKFNMFFSLCHCFVGTALYKVSFRQDKECLRLHDFYLYDSQGVKFLRKFKQLLNPAQVFDLSFGPAAGYVIFQCFYFDFMILLIFQLIVFS